MIEEVLDVAGETQVTIETKISLHLKLKDKREILVTLLIQDGEIKGVYQLKQGQLLRVDKHIEDQVMLFLNSLDREQMFDLLFNENKEAVRYG